MARNKVTRTVRRRPNNSWGIFAVSVFTNIPAASKVLMGTIFLSNPGIDETVLRIIGNITIASDNPGAIETQIGSVGLIVVSDEAVAAGVASIPGPSADGDNDGWFAHQTFAMFSSQVATLNMSQVWPFQSKVRRVVQDGSVIAIVIENDHATHGFLAALQFRVLGRVTGT